MDTEKNNIEEAEDPSMEIFSVVRDLDALYHKWFELCAEEHEYRNHSLSRNALVKDLPDELFQKAEYYFQVAEDHRTIEKKEFIEGHYLMKDTVMPRTYEYLWVGFYYKLLDLVKQN